MHAKIFLTVLFASAVSVYASPQLEERQSMPSTLVLFIIVLTNFLVLSSVVSAITSAGASPITLSTPTKLQQ